MKQFLTAVLIASCATAGFAQDRVFTRTYQSNVLPKGSFDLEYWSTLRTGKVGENSPYAFGRHLDSRLELEFGLGKNIQTAFYFNTGTFKYALLDESAADFPLHSESETSFSNEWKFKLSDPVANRIGSALYLELGASADEFEIETKVILDKRLGNNLFALNLVGELEMETELEKDGDEAERELELEIPLELDLAYMHFFKPTLGLGFEVVEHNDLTSKGDWEHSVLFAGPTLFFSQGKFFGTFNLLPQIANLRRTDEAPGIHVYDEHEALEARLLIGYSF